MNKEEAIDELKQWLKGETVLSWNASEKLASQLHEKIESYAKQQAIAFATFRDNYQREERKRVRGEEKRLGGMITWIGASDEAIYTQFIESQTPPKQ